MLCIEKRTKTYKYVQVESGSIKTTFESDIIIALVECIFFSESNEGNPLALVGERFVAALAVLYLTLVSDWVGHCHFRILTQRVTFET